MQLRQEPATLILSRQALPTLDRTKYASAAGVAKGAYVLADSPSPRLLLLATGSEVSLAVDAYEQLKKEGIASRVVSMPCWELFEQQSDEYKESVLPAAITARVSVEAATTFGWSRYTGLKGRNVGMHSYGASAPVKAVMKHFGFTAEKIIEEAKKLL